MTSVDSTVRDLPLPAVEYPTTIRVGKPWLRAINAKAVANCASVPRCDPKTRSSRAAESNEFSIESTCS